MAFALLNLFHGSVEPMDYINPEGWPRPPGFSNAAAATGRIVKVAGQIGRHPTSDALAEGGFGGQARQALENVIAVLRAAGAGPEHIASLTWYVTDLAAYRGALAEVGAAYRATIGKHFPAMTMVQVAGLLDPDAMVEIEATAVMPA